jgi:cell division protein FtsI (penicillin-binding protein 3)
MANIKKSIMWRVAFCFLVVAFFALGIAYKMFRVQMAEGDKWLNQSDSLAIRHQSIEPSRGNIYSANGRLLATSMPIYEVAFDPMVVDRDTFLRYIPELSSRLSQLFPETSAEQFRRTFETARKRQRNYVLIKRKVNYNQLKEMKQFPIFRLGRYEGGLISFLTTRRVHPAGQLAFRTVGYYTEDNPGVGLERSYTEELNGREGVRLVERISGGYRPLNMDNLIEPENGHDIHTTINMDFQEITHMALSRALLKHNAHHGSAVVMEVATGKIVAISNLENKGDGLMVENYNYAVGESYEPGSIFKVFSAMAALEDDLMDPGDSMNIHNGERHFSGRPMRDSDKGKHKYLHFDKAFALSSNVFFSSLIFDNYKSKPEKYISYLKKLDLHRKTGIDILGEAEPFLNHPESPKWSKITLPWLAIGYENQHTPLQILTAYNGVINLGKMMKPYLVSKVTDAGLVVQTFEPKLIRKVCSESTSRSILGFTALTVEKGTASNIKSDIVSMGGKTGTAQIAGSAGYQQMRRYNASFIGHFPADKPVYSVIVMINRPSNGVFYATQVSAPVFKEIAEKIYTINVLKDVEHRDSTYYPGPLRGDYQDLQLIASSLGFRQTENGLSGMVEYQADAGTASLFPDEIGTMPDLTGLGLRDALFLAQSLGLNPVVKGKGHVKNQSPEKGREVKEGQTIYISLGI